MKKASQLILRNLGFYGEYANGKERYNSTLKLEQGNWKNGGKIEETKKLKRKKFWEWRVGIRLQMENMNSISDRMDL